MNFTKDFFDRIDINQCADSLAIHDDEISFTYKELRQEILRKVSGIKSAGFQVDDKVIFMRPDSAQWLIDFFATIYLGGQVILLPWNCSPSRLIHTSDLTKAKWISCEFNDFGSMPDSLTVFPDQISTSISAVDFADIDHDHVSLWLSSSGTSGKMPKSVMHRHSSMIRSIDILQHTYGVQPAKNFFCTAKLSFQYGLFHILYGLFSGAKVVLTRHVPSPERIMSISKSHKITHIFSTPTVLSSLVRSKLEPSRLSTVETVVSGGEHLPSIIEQEFFKKYSKKILNSIGMSEVIICVIGNTPTDYVFGTLGKPWNQVEIKVVDDEEIEVNVDSIGELMIKTPTCALGYFDDQEASKKVFKDGWYKTNDLVQKLEHGSVRFVGRKNDCDKINGLFVSPVDVENTILNYKGIKECMVSIISTGPYHRKILVSNIVLDDPTKEFYASDLRKFLSESLEPHMIPKLFKVVDTIPTTFTTKKVRSKIIIDHNDLVLV